MPAKEIKALRQTGKLEEALSMAKTELQAEPDNIWAKRNLSWVYYEFLKHHTAPEHFDEFISWLTAIKDLQLPDDEKLLFEQLSWQAGMMAFTLTKTDPIDVQKCIYLFESIETISFPKPSAGYSFLFKAFHKALKESGRYVRFADWWGLENFMPEDFQKEKLKNGKEIMSVAEQAYIAYSKHLLPNHSRFGELIFDKEKVLTFLPVLSGIVEKYPQLQYPPYFYAKLLLAIGDKGNMLEALLPFAKKKLNDFWVWDILAEAFPNDPEKIFACYCRALSCNSPEEMLVSLRQKMAGVFISKQLYTEAKTEIELLVNVRNAHGYKIPAEVLKWQSQDWYKNAVSQKSNNGFYREYTSIADSILFSDTPEETVIVDFVNSDKKVLSFIASETKLGSFKYGRFFREVRIGDILKVRFQNNAIEGRYQAFTVSKTTDEAFKRQFLREVEGSVKILPGKSFGFLDDVYIHPTMISRLRLTDGMYIKGKAMKSFNQDKKQWGWKLIALERSAFPTVLQEIRQK